MLNHILFNKWLFKKSFFNTVGINGRRKKDVTHNPIEFESVQFSNTKRFVEILISCYAVVKRHVQFAKRSTSILCVQFPIYKRLKLYKAI